MGWIISVAGLLVVMVALRDIFHTLWHPSGFGVIAKTVFRSVWRLTRHGGPTRRGLAGPVGVVGTVATWTGLVMLGWMLVYWPHMPDGFYFGSALRPEESSDPVAALYLSMVTVATLGFGDIIPADPVLRVLAPLQALVGFVLLTAAISWALQIYPALGRRRSVARRLDALRSQGASSILAHGHPSVAAQMLESVTQGLIQAETDLLQYEESYYFAEREPGMSLPATLPYTLEMVDAGRRSSAEEVRLAADVLADALRGLADRLDSSFLDTGSTSTRDVLTAFARDHMQEPQPTVR